MVDYQQEDGGYMNQQDMYGDENAYYDEQQMD